MGNKKIDEFSVGENIEGFFLIKSVTVKTSSNSKKFMDFTLADKTGEINAKLWECTEEDKSKYVVTNLVKVRGMVTEWQGKLQLRIAKIRPVLEEDNLIIEEFIPSAPIKAESMLNEVLKYADKIKNDDISKIVKHIIEENKDMLLIYPAAKQNHHAVRSGLLYHIMRMLMTAEKLSEIYPYINSDLLFAGVILHDIAKIDEMDASELGIVTEYTIEGNLLGHITQGIKKIDRVARELEVDEEISMLLQHMVLSHHYEPEFGSPKKPMIPEAELLHYIDLIDARMYDMEKVLNNTETRQFSDRVWVLENRRMYKMGFGEE